jgi:hypothetical protein
MEKNYVYKVRANGIVYDNLASAVEDCVKDLRAYIGEFGTYRASKPIVVKINGGYQVMMTDMYGDVYKRGIDVFIPKHLVEKVDYYIDELRETSVCSCDEEDDDDYDDDDYDEEEEEEYDDDDEEDDDDEDEEEDDEPLRYCEQCGNKYKLSDLVDINGSDMCKHCALEYLEDNY